MEITNIDEANIKNTGIIVGRNEVGKNIKWIEWIASLRGISAIFVFFSHSTFLPFSKDILFVIGRIGVTCFFLMTGYLSIQSRMKKNRKQYALNRFLRMYPVYWVILALTCILHYKDVSKKLFILNMTLFEEFVGYDAILGESWMMPIQLVYYFFVMIFGVQIFRLGISTRKTMQRGIFLEVLCTGGAVLVSIARYVCNIPFPTAFFLLLCVAVIGVYIKEIDDENIEIKDKARRIAPILLIFEAGFLVSSYLSYQSAWVLYEIAYNTGIALFFLFAVFNNGKGFINWISIEIGKVGFTLFLGARIPVLIIEKFVSLDNNINLWMSLVIKFVLAFGFAEIITAWIEKPLLRWGKKLEEKLA